MGRQAPVLADGFDGFRSQAPLQPRRRKPESLRDQGEQFHQVAVVCPTYYDFHYDPPPSPTVHPNEITAALIEAQRFHALGDYRKAADTLSPVVALDDLARPLLLDCLVKLKDAPALIATFDPPTSTAEAIHVVDALWAEGRRDRLGDVLMLPLIVESADPSVIEIRKKYAMRLTR